MGCSTCVRHPCFILTLVIVVRISLLTLFSHTRLTLFFQVACLIGVGLRLLSLEPDTGIPPARRLLADHHTTTTQFINDTPRRGPRRALLFSPLRPVTGVLPADPTEFSSWSSWQPRTWSFNINDETVGSINAQRSGYTGFAWSGQASVEIPKGDQEDKEE